MQESLSKMFLVEGVKDISDMVETLHLDICSIMERVNVSGEFPLLCFGEEETRVVIPIFDPVHFALLPKESEAGGEDLDILCILPHSPFASGMHYQGSLGGTAVFAVDRFVRVPAGALGL